LATNIAIEIAIENGRVEIVSFPMKNGDFPQFFVCLPEINRYEPLVKHMTGHGKS